MYTVKIISNTVSENLERLVGFYIDEVIKEHPGAILDFQYQALQGIREDIYTCMITVNTGIIAVHHPSDWQPSMEAIALATRMNEATEKRNQGTEELSRWDLAHRLIKALALWCRLEKEAGSAGMQPASDTNGAG